MPERDWGKIEKENPLIVGAYKEKLPTIERCSCDCKNLPGFSIEEVSEASVMLKDTAWALIPETALQEGMNVELEHCDITHGDIYLTARIALAHLKEDPDYYIKLKKAGL